MNYILDASFALHWCFEDEATATSEALLTQLQDQRDVAFVPVIWSYELLNALGKGVVRGRLEQTRAILLYQEIHALPIRIIDLPVNVNLLALALEHNLAIYDASYLRLGLTQGLSLATADTKLEAAAQKSGLAVIRP